MYTKLQLALLLCGPVFINLIMLLCFSPDYQVNELKPNTSSNSSSNSSTNSSTVDDYYKELFEIPNSDRFLCVKIINQPANNIN